MKEYYDNGVEYRNLCEENAKLTKQLTEAKEIMKRLVDLSNSSRSLLGGTWHETVREAEDFLKDSEVEK